MYCPKITYCFNDDDIRTLNERIKSIANNYNDDQTGWFEVDETQHLTFVDEQTICTSSVYAVASGRTTILSSTWTLLRLKKTVSRLAST